MEKVELNDGSATFEADALTTRPMGQHLGDRKQPIGGTQNLL